MNLKERIEIIDKIKNVSSSSEIEIKRELDAVDIFVKSETVEKIIKNIVSGDKNIVIFCPSYIDKILVSNYIRSFIDDGTSVEILSDISDNLPFVSAEKVIVPEPNVAEIIKIFELILCDFKTFIIAMHLKSFANVLESLRTLIALNSPNLSSDNVEHLIGMSGAVLVYADRTEDGLFEVSNIGEIIYKNNTAFLDLLYSSDEIVQEESEQDEVAQDEVLQEELEQIEVKQAPQIIENADTFEPFVEENCEGNEAQPIEENFETEESEQEFFEENSEVIEGNEQPQEFLEQVEVNEVAEETFEENAVSDEEALGAVEENEVFEEPLETFETNEVLEETFEAVETNDEAPSCATEEKDVPKVNKYKLLKEKIKNRRA